MIQRVPRKPQRGLRSAPEPDVAQAVLGDLAVEPKKLLDAVDELADIRVSLRVPMDCDDAERRSVEIVDAHALPAVANLLQPLAAVPALAATAGVDASALQETAHRVEWMTEIYDCYDYCGQQVDISLRLIAKVQRDAHAQVDEAVQAFLQDPQVPADKRREVAAELGLITKVRAALQQSRQTQSERTQAQTAQDAEKLASEQRREEVLRTISRLRRGGSATPEELRQARDQLRDDPRPDAGDRRDGPR